MYLARLQKSASKKTVRVAGLMSGTSADGIDVVIADFTVNPSGYTGHTICGFDTIPYTLAASRAIKDAAGLTVQGVAELDLVIGKEFGQAVLAVCGRCSIDPATIDCIGSHGQTVYHHSSVASSLKTSLQLGCADTIAAAVHAPVFYDFRRKDIVYGGEGAPLTPFCDAVLYGASPFRAVLNLGGIANITVLGKTPLDVVGFDTGPANAPLDRLVSLLTNGAKPYDIDGLLASSGTADPALVQLLLSKDSFIQAAPPKSTGFEMYGDSFVRYLLGLRGGVADVHLLASVVEYIAQSIAFSIRHHIKTPLKELVLAGGGAKNHALRLAIAKAVAPVKVTLSDDLGISSDSREALSFALLALYALLGIPTSLPQVTGVGRQVCLGKVAFP